MLKSMQENEISLAHAAVQIVLLSGQDFFRNDEGLVDLLATALVRNADNLAHIDAMVKRWVNTTRETLHPSDVPKLADLTADPPRRVELPAPCEVCKAAGDWPNVVERKGRSAAARCGCARGQKLLAADLERIARPLPAPVEDNQMSIFELLEKVKEQLSAS